MKINVVCHLESNPNEYYIMHAVMFGAFLLLIYAQQTSTIAAPVKRFHCDVEQTA